MRASAVELDGMRVVEVRVWMGWPPMQNKKLAGAWARWQQEARVAGRERQVVRRVLARFQQRAAAQAFDTWRQVFFIWVFHVTVQQSLFHCSTITVPLLTITVPL